MESPLAPVPSRHAGRWLLGGVLLLGVGAAIAGGVWSSRPPKATYRTQAVDIGTITTTITASGTLAASRTVQVGSQISGRIMALAVDFNSPVKKGQILARLDPRFLQAEREQARAGYVSAQASVTRANAQAVAAGREAARSAMLVNQQLIAVVDLEVARTNWAVTQAQRAVAEAALTQARATLQQAEINLGYTDIVSPIDGVVIARNVDVGQTVAASLQAPTLFLLAEDLRRLEAHTSVAEADIGRLQVGMPATFTVDAFANTSFEGEVRQIRNAPQTLQNVVTYDAVVDVDNADGRLRPGLTTNVTFEESVHEDVLRIPNAALRFQPSADAMPRSRTSPSPGASPSGKPDDGKTGAIPSGEAADGQTRRSRRGGKRVWVLEAGQLKMVRVRTGPTDGSFTEVLPGSLAEGAEVVIEEENANANAASPRPRRGGGNRMPRI